MNRFLSFPLIIFGTLCGCTTEVDLIAPGGSVPVVWCLLDPASEVQYVRIAQTWSIPANEEFHKPGAGEIRGDENILVYMVADVTDGTPIIYYFNPVDTIEKEQGWFPYDGQRLFGSRIPLIPGCKYSLYVHFLDTDRVVYGQTRCLAKPFVIIDPELVVGRRLSLFPGTDYFVRVHAVPFGSIFQSTMTFHYMEINHGMMDEKSLRLPQKFVFEEDSTVKYVEQRISGERFYIDLVRTLHADEGTRRIPLRMDFFISCGGEDLALKIHAEGESQSFSILEVNSFENAFGVFSCLTHKTVFNVPLSRYMVDSLATNPLTKPLGFLTQSEIDSMNYAR